MRSDKERLDWLERWCIDRHMADFIQISAEYNKFRIADGWDNTLGKSGDLREAIDEAMDRKNE